METVLQFTNSLVNETSPYLLQHAHNPVNWYPWTEEAFVKARSENKPIFLSIGYSACHWCHVMVKESFENETIALVLNEHFISIKVDREERPDLDEIYMDAVQTLTGSGGWPLSVFLTPDLKPFYGGTYFPPENRLGYPGFKILIATIAKTWEENHTELVENSKQLTHALKQAAVKMAVLTAPDTAGILNKAVQELMYTFDVRFGGFGAAPKFPQSMAIEFLLHQYVRTQEPELLQIITKTLDNVASGGIYDHLGGGFHRYSTDKMWLVPHFEKMLYDNALLSDLFLKAYQLTGNPLYESVARETFGYILREMRDSAGGFHSTQDADSKGEEGTFYLWTYEEIIDALGKKDGQLFCNYYSVRKDGNFSSSEKYHRYQNILHKKTELPVITYNPEQSESALLKKIGSLRSELYTVRSKRSHPGKDDKIITGWNGLMISSLVHGYQILGESRYLKAAQKAARFILTELYPDRHLLRIYRQGKVRQPAYLTDYAYLINALIDLYEATFDLTWLLTAEELADTMIKGFWDRDNGGFFLTSQSHKNLILRTKPLFDTSLPSGNATGVLALLRMSKLLDNTDYFAKAEKIVTGFTKEFKKTPRAYLALLKAADFYYHPPKEIAFCGRKNSRALKKLLTTVHGEFIPNKVLALLDDKEPDNAGLEKKIPLLSGKRMVSGRATIYVCKNFACQLPMTEPEKLKEMLTKD